MRSATDWRELFEERAAIMEYDGGLTRDRAELEAFTDTRNILRAHNLFNDRIREEMIDYAKELKWRR